MQMQGICPMVNTDLFEQETSIMQMHGPHPTLDTDPFEQEAVHKTAV